MSESHLQDLRSGLERRHWHVTQELPGDNHGISAVWEVSRPSRKEMFHLEFQGLDESTVLPIERAYACNVREAPDVSAYFARVGRTWPEELQTFFEKLDAWAT